MYFYMCQDNNTISGSLKSLIVIATIVEQIRDFDKINCKNGLDIFFDKF